MKSEFYTDGLGMHKITLTPQNEVEKKFVESMILYRAEITATKQASEPDGTARLEIVFSEQSYKISPARNNE